MTPPKYTDPDAPKPSSTTKPKSTTQPPPKSTTAPAPKGAPADTGYGDAAWGQVLTAQGIPPAFQSSALSFLQQFSTRKPWATAGWFSAMSKEFMASPEQMAFYQTYGNDYLNIWVDYLVNGAGDPSYLQNKMMARGMTAVDAMKNLKSTSNYRGPGGGGGATKAQQYAAAEAAIRNQAATLGYETFGDAQIKALAKTAVDNSWSGDQLTDHLVNGATGDWGKLGKGTLTAGVDAIKAQAAAQLIQISDVTARQWSKRLASGELDGDGLRSLIQAQAAARYGWAADQIGKGITMADFLAPSRDRIAQVLEIPPEKVDLMDPQYMKMVTATDDKGVQRPATDTEIIRNARSDARWANTSNARSTLSSAAVMLRNYVEGR